MLDSALKEITYRVEYELELNDDLRSIIDFDYDLVKDNAHRAAEAIKLVGD